MARILFYGDVYAKPGRDVVYASLPVLQKRYSPDFVIANIENCAHGKGPLPELAQQFLDSGVDVVTTGNHVWDNKLLIPLLSSSTRIIRPANYPDHMQFKNPGRGSTVVQSTKNKSIQLGVIQVQGRVYMNALECPFRTAEREIQKLDAVGVQMILIDFHAEASSEKQAFFHYMNGKVSAVLGTHSHVQTADETILSLGTAVITDVGMCGCLDSVIGAKKELSIERFISQRPVRLEPADGPGTACAVIVDVDERTGKAQHIERIREKL